MFSVLKGFRHGFAWIFLEGQLGFADVSLKRDIYEEHLTSLDPRRAAEECGEFPTALDARSAAKGRRVLKREPTGGAPTGAYGKAARFGAAGLGTHKGCPYGGGGRLGLLGRCLAWLVWAGSHSGRATTWGKARVAAGRQLRIALTLAAARGFRRGGVAGAEPPHKGGRLRPTAQLQWSAVSVQWSEGARGTVSPVWVSYWIGGV